MRGFLIGLATLVGAIVTGAHAVPWGEVVTLHTVDADGRDHESALWLVELPEGVYLRAGNPDAGWLARLRAHPRVELEREDGLRAYRAVPSQDPALRQAVNEAMAEKYGLADRIVGSTMDLERAVPIRLEPGEERGAARRP